MGKDQPSGRNGRQRQGRTCGVDQALWAPEPTHVALYGILGGLASFLLFCGVMNYFVWAPSAKVWGTYTVTGSVCSARNGGGEECHDAGTWTSDDGKQNLDDVGLLKSLPVGTVVRAYAQPHTPWATKTVSVSGDDSGMYWKLAGAIGVCLVIMTVSYIHWNPLPLDEEEGEGEERSDDRSLLT